MQPVESRREPWRDVESRRETSRTEPRPRFVHFGFNTRIFLIVSVHPARFNGEFQVEQAKNRGITRVAVPVTIVLVAAAAIITLLLLWSATRADSASREQEQQLVAGFADKLPMHMALSLEANTTWDEAVRQAEKPVPDLDWTDSVYGPGLFKLLDGGSESYLLDAHDRPYYAAIPGKHIDPQSYARRAAMVAPMLAALRRMMLNPKAHLPDPQARNPVVADIREIDGVPAMITLDPIASETGKLIQIPGTEHVFVFVYPLSPKDLNKYGDKYHVKGIRFSWTGEHGRGEAVRPMMSLRTGRAAGYFVWRPFAPGSVVLGDMFGPLLGALALVGAVVFFLLRRIRRRTTELMASEAQAKHLAFHDALTGLPNRALFEDRLERALAATRRHPDAVIALLYLDLDRFKKVNDTLGHPAGDELLREVAKRLTEVVRGSDTVARLGGDEFAIVQTQLDSHRDITTLCERIIDAIKEPFELVGSQIFVGISIGVARSGVDGLDRTELSRKADIALYSAKSGGRGRFEIFAQEMDATIQIRRTMESDLRSALYAGDQLKMCYQPKYDAGSGAIVGIEALVRWNHPDKGILSPTTFVPIAEETGLIEPLGEWVLERSCAAALAWPAQTISVNVSAVQLRNPFFAHRVLEILRKTRFDPSRLELEITETSFMESIESCIPNLKMLRAVGIRIALDDFGTGYSSFTHLRSFDIDRIKIDKSFTIAIDGSGDSNAIIKAIVDLAHSTGIQITAEGVETMHQSRFLSAVGCDELQGFLMSRPLSLKGMDDLLGVARPPSDQALAA
jgi:diguanylate cyclase (GGDEF)-like protein